MKYDEMSANRLPRASNIFSEKVALALILAVSLMLRVTIAVRGGQYYWTDESRFVLSQRAANDFLGGHFLAGIDALFSNAGHMLFEVIGVVPALIQKATGDCVFVPAIFFGSFSVWIILLVWRLVKSQGGTPREALFAAFLISACNSFFYYARHIFPYDIALCFFLCAALYGFRRGILGSLSAGLLAGLGFLTYNGYWLFGGTVLLLTVVSHQETFAKRVLRAGICVCGLFLPIMATLMLGRFLGHDLLKSFVEFSRTVIGDRGNAWHVILEYFWASERSLFLFLSLAVVISMAAWLHRNAEERVELWLLGGLLYYLGLVWFSDVFGHFTVSARHSRPLAIFLCLIGGWVLAKISVRGRFGNVAVGMMLIVVLVQAVLNFAAPLSQVYPADFTKRAQAIIQQDTNRNAGLYRVLADGYFESTEATAVRNRPYIVLFERPHPLQFVPYAYDNYNERLRMEFRLRDISMKAVRLLPERPDGRIQISRADGLLSPLLGALRLEVMLDPGLPPMSQPIVSCGKKGAGDEVFVEFLDDQTVRLGFDHWSQPAIYSRPIRCDMRGAHVLIISFGSLYPNDEPIHLATVDESRTLRHVVLVTFDGNIAISQPLDTYPALPQSVVLFHNVLGFSTATQDFAGRVLSESPVSPKEIIQEIVKR